MILIRPLRKLIPGLDQPPGESRSCDEVADSFSSDARRNLEQPTRQPPLWGLRILDT